MSVDSPEESAKLVDKLNLDFPILSDPDARVIGEWGLVHEGGKPGGGVIARPGIFLVDGDGTISWRNLTEDYRVRVRPEHLLEALGSPN